MGKIGKKAAVKLLFALCIVMQAVVVLPHHHHEGSAAACVDVFHCVPAGEGDCGSGREVGAHDHNHDRYHDHDRAADRAHNHDADDSDCRLKRTDYIASMRKGGGESTAQLPQFTAILFAAYCCAAEHSASCVRLQDELSPLIFECNRGALPIHTHYIAAATPPRAPSFTV